MPALQVLDAVGNGNVECGYTSGYYYLGKDPSLALVTCLPFGLSSRQHWAWLTHGGGRDLYKEVYRDQGVVGIPAGNTGAQMGGWFGKEIKSVEDLKGLKFRIAGYGGNVLGKLGVVRQQLGGTDIYPALERGVIDGAEWVGPYDDEKLGFHRVAPYYYYPGFWEYSPSIDLMVNAKAYEALPAEFRAVLDAACAEAWHWMAARYDVLNPAAMRRLLAGGAQLRGFPREVLTACYRASQELFTEIGEQNPRFKRIHEKWDTFRIEQTQWMRVAEDLLRQFPRRGDRAAVEPIAAGPSGAKERPGDDSLPAPTFLLRRHPHIAQLNVVVRRSGHLHPLARRPDHAAGAAEYRRHPPSELVAWLICSCASPYRARPIFFDSSSIPGSSSPPLLNTPRLPLRVPARLKKRVVRVVGRRRPAQHVEAGL